MAGILIQDQIIHKHSTSLSSISTESVQSFRVYHEYVIIGNVKISFLEFRRGKKIPVHSLINPYLTFFEGRWHSMHLAGDTGSGEAPVWRRTLLIYPAKLSSGGPLTFSLTGTGIIGCNLHKEFKQTLAP